MSKHSYHGATSRSGSTMKDQSDDPSHHKQTLLPRSYISLPLKREPHTHTGNPPHTRCAPVALPGVDDVLVGEAVLVGRLVEEVEQVLDDRRHRAAHHQHRLEEVVDVLLQRALATKQNTRLNMHSVHFNSHVGIRKQ